MALNFDFAIPETEPFSFVAWLCVKSGAVYDSARKLDETRSSVQKLLHGIKARTSLAGKVSSVDMYMSAVVLPAIHVVIDYIVEWEKFVLLLKRNAHVLMVDNTRFCFTWTSIMSNRSMKQHGIRYESTNVHFETSMLVLSLAALYWCFAKFIKSIVASGLCADTKEEFESLKKAHGLTANCGRILDVARFHYYYHQQSPTFPNTRQRVFPTEYTPASLPVAPTVFRQGDESAQLRIGYVNGDPCSNAADCYYIDDNDDYDEDGTDGRVDVKTMFSAARTTMGRLRSTLKGSVCKTPPELSLLSLASLRSVCYAECQELLAIMSLKTASRGGGGGGGSSSDFSAAAYYFKSSLFLHPYSLPCPLVRRWMQPRYHAALCSAWLHTAYAYKTTVIEDSVVKMKKLSATVLPSIYVGQAMMAHAILASHCAVQYAPSRRAHAAALELLNTLLLQNCSLHRHVLYYAHLYRDRIDDYAGDLTEPLQAEVAHFPFLHDIYQKWAEITLMSTTAISNMLPRKGSVFVHCIKDIIDYSADAPVHVVFDPHIPKMALMLTMQLSSSK